jgi:hypothetical protein
VPSLRASAASLNFSMRVLMSSLISDGLSVVCHDLGDSRKGFEMGCADYCDSSALQAHQLAAQRSVDDHVAGLDHRAADQLSSTATSSSTARPKRLGERGLDQLLELGGGQGRAERDRTLTTRSASARRSSYRPAISPSSGSRGCRSAGEEAPNAVGRLAVRRGNSDTRSLADELGAAEQGLHRGSAATRRRTPSAPTTAPQRRLARESKRGAGVGTGEGEGLAHRSILRAARPGRRSAPCGRWRRFRA